MTTFGAWLSDLSERLLSVVFLSVPIAGQDIHLIVIWLFAGMVFFTLRLGFINLRGFHLGWKALFGKTSGNDAPGDITAFQALSTALSGTVGLGNIAGVAIAIAMGGPGAAFWMILIGFFAMSLKMAEATLGVKFRKQRADGTTAGGPMYYLKYGLASLGAPKAGYILSGLYAVFALFAFIQIVQVNQSWSQISTVMELPENKFIALGYGIFIAGLAGLVLLGGVKSIARITSRLTPTMCGLYIVGVLAVLVVNASGIGTAVTLIVTDAFNTDAATGGIMGAFVAGARRAIYSNEAGIGSAAIAHAPVKTNHPGTEGFVALLEPFIDTMLVCTATALAIITTGVWNDGHTDIAMTSAAFGTVSGFFPIILAVTVSLFAFSTILAVGYYGRQIIEFLFGDRIWVKQIYLLFYCAALPVGTIVSVTTVTNLIDSMFFLLSIPNLIGLYLMSGIVRREVRTAGEFLNQAS